MPYDSDSNIAAADALTLLLHNQTWGGNRGGHEMAFREWRRDSCRIRGRGHGNPGCQRESD
jgi:hypothetical protein